MTPTQLPPPSPAVDLLTALGCGDLEAVVGLLSPDAVVSVSQLGVRSVGADDALAGLRIVQELFPDVGYRAGTRSVGRGLVIDNGAVSGTQTGGTEPSGGVLDAPVRIRVTHDDAVVHSVTVDVILVPVMHALGRTVDRFALAAARVQAIRFDDTAGMTTYQLHQPSVPAAKPDPTGEVDLEPAPSRRRVKVIAIFAVVAMALGAGAWWLNGPQQAPAEASARDAAPTPSQTSSPAAQKPAPSVKPQKLPPPSKAPAVVLEADLAFGRDSATVSPAARAAVVHLAQRARKAGLEGAIRVDGYTDSLGSAAHGLELSQRRAQAVAGILRAELKGSGLGVAARGHGEADAPFSNATEAGRARNRRVTITLPSA